MTKIDIISGFLGAGKTTLIKKLLSEVYAGQKIVLIENEFGEIGIDGGFLQDAGVQITEMNSGCICCSLVGDFGRALEKVLTDYCPDRVLIEPSGVGKLSDVIAAVEKVEGVEVGCRVTVADASKVKIYMRNFGEFYNNQVQAASAVLLSRTQNLPREKLEQAVALLREKNEAAVILTTPWDELDAKTLIEAMAGEGTLSDTLHEMMHEHEHHDGECGHEHEHHHHDGECGHEHEHHHHDGECGHEHEHHHHDGECGHEHEHHHHDGECGCGHDHHHHHAEEAFTSWGVETVKKFSAQDIENALYVLDSGVCGTILRAKGILPCTDGGWIYFDYVPQEHNIRMGAAAATGKLCVIGAKMEEKQLGLLFGV